MLSISVVIPAYNEEKFIENCLRSLKNQTLHPSLYEIIVVDNGSNDNTTKIALSFGARVISEPQRGIARAKQKGFEHARGEIIASIDADSIAPTHWLETILASFKKQQNLAVLSGTYLFMEIPFHIQTIVYASNMLTFSLLNWYCGTNMAIQKSIFLKTSGFNTQLSMGEDGDMGRRLSKLGKAKFSPSLTVKTSARRYFKNGLSGLVGDYTLNIFPILFNLGSKNLYDVKPGSQL